MKIPARLALIFALALLPLLASAQQTHDGLPVIAAGREEAIRALFQPFGPDRPPLPGWPISSVSIDGHQIQFILTGPGGTKGTVTLAHPRRMTDAREHTASFALRREDSGDAGAQAALDKLVEAIRRNDTGGFWPSAPPAVGGSSSSLWERANQADVGGVVTEGLGRLQQTLVHAGTFLGDGIVLFVLAMAFLLAHLTRVLRKEARWVPFGLLGLVIAAGLLRLGLSLEAPMNAWPYERIIPIARRTFDGFLLPWLSQTPGRSFYLTEIIFRWDLLLATITPLAFFAHARFVLHDVRAAFAAAAILTVLPNHLHFSRADSEFVQSLATSSLTFVVLYAALRESSPRWRALCFVLLPLLCSATYFVRPENMVFYVIDIGAILLTSGVGVPRSRQILAFSLITVAAAFACARFLFALYAQNIHEGLDLQTLWNAWSMLFDPGLNTLINVSITPPGLTLLALYGLWCLRQRGEGKRALFLAAWLMTFFVVHSYVRPTAPEMQARYHMHLITPLLMLAAATTPDLLRRARWVPVSIAVYLALSPLLHIRFIRDTDFNEMQEFAFLREQRANIPDDCTILEFSPAVDPSLPDHVFASRWKRMGTRLFEGRPNLRWEVLNSGQMKEASNSRDAFETLSPDARRVVQDPPECLYVYEGLSCRSHRPIKYPLAPVCTALREQLELEAVAVTHLRSRVYDEVNAGRVYSLEDGRTIVEQTLEPGEVIPLTLYRVLGRKPPREAEGGSPQT